MTQVNKLQQKTLDIMVAVNLLALESGYIPWDAKALAVGACDRLRQGGIYDFAAKLKAIRSHTAKVGTHSPDTYDRLLADRRPSERVLHPETFFKHMFHMLSL